MAPSGWQKIMELSSRPSSPVLPSSNGRSRDGWLDQLKADLDTFSRRPSLHNVWRSRPLLALVSALLSLVLLLTNHMPFIDSPFAPSQVQLQVTDPFAAPDSDAYRLLAKGAVRPSLLQELSTVSWNEVVLISPRERPWTRDASTTEPVPWAEQAFLPFNASSPAAAQSQHRKTTPPPTTTVRDQMGATLDVVKHTLDVLPRIPLVPHSAPAPASLMFGMVTTPERAKIMSELWSPWLLAGGPGIENQPGCLILLDKRTRQSKIREVEKVFEKRGFKCGLRRSDHDRYEVRVLSMLREMRDYAGDIRRKFDWYVMGDDDTFWLDMNPLLRMLSKYDPNKDWFIGSPTEGRFQMNRHGRMAYGGAGVLINSHLYNKLYTIWDECYDEFKTCFGGDEMVTRCAALGKGKTKQSVTSEEKSMHQMDIPGDATGVLQGGLPFLNVHHYMGGGWAHFFSFRWHREPFQQILLLKRVANFLGGDNMFRRYAFGDGKWVLTLGYSVSFYEHPLTRKDLAMVEHTWNEDHLTSYNEREMVYERDGPKKWSVKQTFYIDDILVLSPTSALMTYRAATARTDWGVIPPHNQRASIRILWGEACSRGEKGVCEVTEARAKRIQATQVEKKPEPEGR